MNCLTVDEIYLFLEGELPPQERNAFEDHLASCPGCRQAVELRRAVLKAASSLPDLKLPVDFTSRVMGKIFPQKVPLRSFLGALAIGLPSLTLALLFLFLRSGQSLVDFLLSLGGPLMSFIHTLSLLSAKIFKLVYVLAKMSGSVIQFMIKSLTLILTALSPQAQIILFILLAVSIFAIYGVTRLFLTGEKV